MQVSLGSILRDIIAEFRVSEIYQVMSIYFQCVWINLHSISKIWHRSCWSILFTTISIVRHSFSLVSMIQSFYLFIWHFLYDWLMRMSILFKYLIVIYVSAFIKCLSLSLFPYICGYMLCTLYILDTKLAKMFISTALNLSINLGELVSLIEWVFLSMNKSCLSLI